MLWAWQKCAFILNECFPAAKHLNQMLWNIFSVRSSSKDCLHVLYKPVTKFWVSVLVFYIFNFLKKKVWMKLTGFFQNLCNPNIFWSGIFFFKWPFYFLSKGYMRFSYLTHKIWLKYFSLSKSSKIQKPLNKMNTMTHYHTKT